VLLLVLEEGGEGLIGSGLELGGSPELGGEVSVGLGESVVNSEDVVTNGTGLTGRSGVSIVDTSEGKNLLGGVGSNETSTTGSRDDTEEDGTALAGDLAGDGVGSTELGTPVTTTDRDEVKLGGDDSTTDGTSSFLGATNTNTDVTVVITDNDPGLEAGLLTGRRSLLHGADLHNLILELVAKEVVDDLSLLDREREEEDVIEGLDLLVLHETTELGARNPLLLLVTATTASTARTARATATAFETSIETTTVRFSSVRHNRSAVRKR